MITAGLLRHVKPDVRIAGQLSFNPHFNFTDIAGAGLTNVIVVHGYARHLTVIQPVNFSKRLEVTIIVFILQRLSQSVHSYPETGLNIPFTGRRYAGTARSVWVSIFTPI